MDIPLLALDADILRDIVMGRCRLLERVFGVHKHPFDSFTGSFYPMALEAGCGC
jgi:hypothetical protein